MDEFSNEQKQKDLVISNDELLFTLSQIISNVPSMVILAPFTVYLQALFYGANIGGLGTPIASLASIIAFSLFYQVFPQKKLQFIGTFLLYNFIMLVVLSAVFGSFIIKV